MKVCLIFVALLMPCAGDGGGGIVAYTNAPVVVGSPFTRDEAYRLIRDSDVLCAAGYGAGCSYPDAPIAAAVLLEDPQDAEARANRLLKEARTPVGKIYAAAILAHLGKIPSLPDLNIPDAPVYFHDKCDTDVASFRETVQEIFKGKGYHRAFIFPGKTVERTKIKHYSLEDGTRKRMDKWWRTKDSLLFRPDLDLTFATNILSRSPAIIFGTSLSAEPFAYEYVRKHRDAEQIGISLASDSNLPPAGRLYGLILLHDSGAIAKHRRVLESVKRQVQGKIPVKRYSVFVLDGECKSLTDGSDEWDVSEFFDALDTNEPFDWLMASTPMQFRVQHEYDYMVRLFRRLKAGNAK